MIRRGFLFLLLLMLLLTPISVSVFAFPQQAQNDAQTVDKTTPRNTTENVGTDKAEDAAKSQDNGSGLGNDQPMMPEADTVSFMKSLMALTFVLGLIFFTAYLFKKFTGIKGTGFRGNRVPINLFGTFPLGDKKFLAVVEISGKMFFLGITPSSINMLSPLDIPLPDPSTESPGGDASFENIFKKAKSLLQQRGDK